MRRILWFAIGCLACVAALEIALRMLPVPKGLDPIGGYSTSTLLHYAPGTEVTYSRDWDFLHARRGQINAFGYHGMCDLSAGLKDSLWVIGDSYAEALMLDPSEALAGQLRALRPDRSACTLGISGAPGSEYLAMLDSIPHEATQPTWIVVLNPADVPESRGGRSGFHYLSDDPSQELDGQLRQEPKWLDAARRLALFRYVNYSLDFKGLMRRVGCDLRVSCPAHHEATLAADRPSPLFVAMATRLLDALKQRAAQRQAKLLVVLNAFEPASFKFKSDLRRDRAERTWLRGALAQAGVAVVDVETAFAQAAICRAAGSCYLFRDGHWSTTGHEVIAGQVERILQVSRANARH